MLETIASLMGFPQCSFTLIQFSPAKRESKGERANKEFGEDHTAKEEMVKQREEQQCREQQKAKGGREKEKAKGE